MAQATKQQFRRTWDDKEYSEKANAKDEERAEYAKEAEAALQKGQKAPRRRKEDMPKPTELMRAREGSLELDKNLNKTMVVATTHGKGQPGFYCDVCNRTHKDSIGYLDHLNSRSHLRMLGQTTKMTRSTLNDVRLKIAELRAQTSEAAESKAYDFDARLKEIRALEQDTREKEKMARKEKKLAARREASKVEEQPKSKSDLDMMAAMGFASFGGGLKA